MFGHLGQTIAVENPARRGSIIGRVPRADSADVDTAVRCLKKGAFDYLLKPIDQNRFVTSIGRALLHKAAIASSMPATLG